MDVVRHILAPSISLSDIQGLENRISREKAIKNYKADKYAVLIRGNSEERFVADTSVAHHTLLENGFKSENIYILADAKKKREAFFHPIDDVATKSNVELIMNHLSNIIDERDLLLICLVDHGSRKTVSTFNLKGKDISEIELESYLSKICPGKGILLFDFCYSGGFAERLGKNEYSAIASTMPDRVGRSRAGDSFSGCFFEAFSFRKKSEADVNEDGRVSLQEALDYTKKHHYATKKGRQAPVVKSNIPLDKIFIDE